MRINLLENLKKYGMYTMLLGGALLASCSDDDEAPAEENEVEVFTDVKLIFTNIDNPADTVTARAQDPDGEGVQPLQILDKIALTAGVTYDLTYEIFNKLDLENPIDVGEEILDEDHEHQFFFSFTNNAFANPEGDGNIDDVEGSINYNDKDENDNPVGLSTRWTTDDALEGGEFRVRLQHQPRVKTATSDVEDGDTDFNLLFVLDIQ